MDSVPALYEDKYVRIDTFGVQIKNYYFPTAQRKKILFNKIKGVFTAEELNLSLLDYKGWGMGLSNIWWAIGSRRKLKNLVIECGSMFRAGFSVEDQTTVINLIKEHVKTN